MKSIGLIVAMAEERRPLLRRLPGWQACPVGRFSGYRFHLNGRDCLLVQSGIGMPRAGEATRTLLQAFNPQLLISFGAAGALQDGLHIGDVVCARSASRLDRLAWGLPGTAMPLANLSRAAQAAIISALQPRRARLVWGSAFTTPGAQALQPGFPLPENALLEMETTAIAQAAAEYCVPILALRGVSDNPRQPLPFDPGTLLDEHYRLRVGRLLRLFLRHPNLAGQFGRLRQNTTLAAENVALAVLAALDSAELIQADEASAKGAP